MLELPMDLPAGARLNGSRALLREELAATSALWFSAASAQIETDAASGAVIGWPAETAASRLQPVEPNTLNALLRQVGDRPVLQCQTGFNCGFVANAVARDVSHCSMAVIYHAAADAPPMTLLTLNNRAHAKSEESGNYLFLSDDGETLTLKDTRESFGIETAGLGAPEQPRLAIVTLAGNKLAFAQNLAPAELVAGADPGMNQMADLFVGCRSQRKGLQKTLGQARLHDVFFFPDMTLLLPRSAAESAALLALRRYFLWEY